MEDYRYYLRERYDFYKSTWIGIGLAVFVLGGVLRFVYELIFYWANSGFDMVFFRGGTFGPWIDTHCIAALLMFVILYRLRRQPWFVFLFSAIGGGLVQLGIGLALYYLCGGIRPWNYNLEILNYGSLGGFVCLRSALEFGVLGLLVIYVIAPFIFHMACSVYNSTFLAVWLTIGLICVADIVYNDIVCVMVPGLIGATDVYKDLGFRFLSY